MLAMLSCPYYIIYNAFWQVSSICDYGQRIKNRSFPFGAPGSFFNALEVSQQPTTNAQQPVRAVVARLTHSKCAPWTVHRTRPTVFCARASGLRSEGLALNAGGRRVPTRRGARQRLAAVRRREAAVNRPLAGPTWTCPSRPSPPFLFPPRTSRTCRPRRRRRAP